MGNAEYMGTHPIFESDFDCLTDVNSDLLPCQRNADAERRPSWPSRRTRPTSSVTRSSSDDDVKVKPITSPVSVFVSRTRTSTTPPSTVLLSASPTRTSSPRWPMPAFKVTSLSARPMLTSSHATVSQSVSPTTPLPTALVCRLAAAFSTSSVWTHSTRARSRLTVTSSTRRLMPRRRLHSVATWTLVLPAPPPVPASSASSRAQPMPVWTFPTRPSDSPVSLTVSSTLICTRATSSAATSETTWMLCPRKTRRSTRNTSPSTLPPASTPRTSRRCTPRPTPQSAPTPPRWLRSRSPLTRSDGTVHAFLLLKERTALLKSRPLSSAPNRPRNKDDTPCFIIAVHCCTTRYKNADCSKKKKSNSVVLGASRCNSVVLGANHKYNKQK